MVSHDTFVSLLELVSLRPQDQARWRGSRLVLGTICDKISWQDSAYGAAIELAKLEKVGRSDIPPQNHDVVMPRGCRSLTKHPKR